jgi:hypothetical protein
MSRKIWVHRLSESSDIQALAGGDKPPPLQPRASIYLKSSGGVYPRPYWVPVNRNRSDSVTLFRDQGNGPAAGLKSGRFDRKRDSEKANTRLPCIVRWVGVIIDL